MEMQVVHKGVSKEDIGKNMILSFLFKKKAGATNKFLDKLEVFNLPNPLEPYRDLTNNVFISHILQSAEEDDYGSVIPFSFYSYQGSLQEPPCSERTIMYVASKPIEVSVYSLQLIQEALKFPDQMDQFGHVVITNSVMYNNRNLQRQHGRAIFYYDSTCDQLSRKKLDVVEKGHYEKVIKPAKQYYFVDGEKPSGLPGAWVVTPKEAEGITITPP